MKYTAVMDKIVATEIKVEIVSEGGLILPDSVQDSLPQIMCEVISVGNAVSFTINPGDRFFTHKNSGQIIAPNGDVDNLIRIYNEAEIYCIVKDDVICSCGEGDGCSDCP